MLSIVLSTHSPPNVRKFTSIAGAAAVGARRAALLFPPAAIGLYAAQDPTQAKRVAFTMSVMPARLSRDVWAAIATVADYTWSLYGITDTADLETEKSKCHQRGADRLLQLCMENGGIYIKLCQHIAMLDYLLPEEYCLTMKKHMLDRCPTSDWNSVRKTIEEDFGSPLETIYSEFEQTPIASASLAQVHRAVDAETGERVAGKVQHRGLRETSRIDIMTIDAVMRAVKFFAGVDYMWLVEELKTNLPCELDFKIEAANAERCASNLNSKGCRVRGRVVVPRIDYSKTSHRVITMEFIDGVKVVDKAGLKKLKAPPAEVARLISQTL